jgi:hypothetical protein
MKWSRYDCHLAPEPGYHLLLKEVATVVVRSGLLTLHYREGLSVLWNEARSGTRQSH